MVTKVTDMHQATIADVQEKIAETHRYLQLEEEFEQRHQTLMERRIENAIKIGQNLCYFKATLPHGKFIPFVQTEFRMSQSTAWDYMNLAQNHGRVHDLPLRSAFELASPSMPTTVIEMVETKQIPPTVAAIREAKRETLALPTKSPALAALQSSESNEWYTPLMYVKAARELMGNIDLDPASCQEANKIIQADRIYTQEDNGLTQSWQGRIWLNPPYGMENGVSNQELWTRTLIERFTINCTVTEAVLLVNATTEAKWFQPLYAYLICLTDHRIRFYNTSGDANQPTQGNALVYFGKDKKQQNRFIDLFSHFGTVIERAKKR